MFYFVSDIHLGSADAEQSLATEKLFVQWLERVSADATAIFLCGDIFDFWFEYRQVVPKGAVRALGKIAELCDRGIRVVFVAGNHDMWVRDYFTKECGVEIYTTPTTFILGRKSIHVAHGDNINVRGNLALKFMNCFFRSKVARFLFSWLIHPDLALWFGRTWSGSSRKKHGDAASEACMKQVAHLKDYVTEHYGTYGDHIYIFGHLHLALEYAEEKPKVFFMNDWSEDPRYVSLTEDGDVKLLRVKELV